MDVYRKLLILLLIPISAMGQTGSINVDQNHNGHRIYGLPTPTAGNEAATKAYADSVGGGGGGSVSLTATSPVIVTPSPITGTGVISLSGTSYGFGFLPLVDASAARTYIGALGSASIDNTAFSSSWAGFTTIAPSKKAVYDELHLFDTDDDGKVNVLDMGAGMVKTDATGVVSAATAGVEYLPPTAISDVAFASSWDTVTQQAPSRNAVYDWGHTFDTNDNGKVNVLDMGAGIVQTDSGGVVSAITVGSGLSFTGGTLSATGGGGSVDDTAFASSWNGITTTAPSKNAVYDELHKIDSADDGTIVNAGTGFRIAGAAASGKMIQGNGTNFVASTPTWPTAAGTSGNVVTSDGTNFVSSPASGGSSMTGRGNADYTILATDRVVVTNAAFTAPRVWTLPAATAVTAGTPITVADLQRTVTSSNTLTIARAGSDTIWPGNTTSYVLVSPGAGLTLVTDGTSKWYTYVSQPGQIITSGQFMQGLSSVWRPSDYQLPTTAGASGKVAQSDGTNIGMSTPTWPTTAGTVGYTVRSDGTNFASYPQDMLNASVSSQSPSTSDVYLTGSNVTVAAGDFKAKGQYRCLFDVTKSAGTGAIVLSVRVGTAGAIGDPAIITFTFGAGTSVADTGTFEVIATWRTVGSGTSAVVQGICRAQHNLATTGLFNNAAAWAIVATTSSGFASNTATNIGVSFNGATAFAGTVTLVQAQLLQ